MPSLGAFYGQLGLNPDLNQNSWIRIQIQKNIKHIIWYLSRELLKQKSNAPEQKELLYLPYFISAFLWHLGREEAKFNITLSSVDRIRQSEFIKSISYNIIHKINGLLAWLKRPIYDFFMRYSGFRSGGFYIIRYHKLIETQFMLFRMRMLAYPFQHE